MDDLQVMLMRDACRQLLMRYAVAVDGRDIDTLVSLYAEEFEWKRPGKEPMRTHAELREFFRELDARRNAQSPEGFVNRHNFTTVCIEPVDEQTAKSIAYSLVFSDYKFSGKLPSPTIETQLVVEYRHEFKKTPKGWKFVSQRMRHIFRRDGDGNVYGRDLTAIS